MSHQCSICYQNFNDKESCNIHIQSRHQVDKILQQLKEVVLLRDTIESVNDIGNEDLEFISESDLITLSQSNRGFLEFILLLHFDDKCKTNMNIRYYRHRTIALRENQTWRVYDTSVAMKIIQENAKKHLDTLCKKNNIVINTDTLECKFREILLQAIKSKTYSLKKFIKF